jgi:hypothetical protein
MTAFDREKKLNLKLLFQEAIFFFYKKKENNLELPFRKISLVFEDNV